MDELLGIALISIHLGILPDEILRIHPDDACLLIQKNEDIDQTFFIDCGLEYNPEKKLFDHHQSKDLGCAALLIFETYFNDFVDSNIHEYVKLVSAVDTKGPNALNDFTFKSDSINYFNFSHKLILKEFENNPLLITSIFSNGIKSIIEFENDKQMAKDWLYTHDNIRIDKINNINLLIYNNPPPLEIASAVKAIDGEIVDENNIHLIYSFDKDDNTIRTLFRTLKEDHLVDLSISNVSNTIFCHKGGFLLKFKPEDDNEWIKIVKESII